MNDITARISQPMHEITISGDEYRELVIKAWKFDALREEAKKRVFLTDVEKAVFGLPEIEEEETDNVD